MADIKKLKQLREETNVSYRLCKEALEEADGDMDKARKLLKAKGAEVAAKKADRDADQGSVFSYIHHNQKVGALAVVVCETDFVAKNEEFQKLGNDLVMHIASTNPESVDELMKQPFIKDPKVTIDDLFKDIILKLGENISIGEFTRYEI